MFAKITTICFLVPDFTLAVFDLEIKPGISRFIVRRCAAPKLKFWIQDENSNISVTREINSSESDPHIKVSLIRLYLIIWIHMGLNHFCKCPICIYGLYNWTWRASVLILLANSVFWTIFKSDLWHLKRNMFYLLLVKKRQRHFLPTSDVTFNFGLWRGACDWLYLIFSSSCDWLLPNFFLWLTFTSFSCDWLLPHLFFWLTFYLQQPTEWLFGSLGIAS